MVTVMAGKFKEILQSTIDTIRDRFGFLAVQKGTALLDSSRNISRSKLIGGHSAGGLEGLKAFLLEDYISYFLTI